MYVMVWVMADGEAEMADDEDVRPPSSLTEICIGM